MPKETTRSHVLKRLRKLAERRLKGAKIRFLLAIEDDFQDDLDRQVFATLHMFEKLRYLVPREPIPKLNISYEWFLFEMRDQDFIQ